MNRWELEKEIVVSALKDPVFKKKLMSNPKKAIQEHFKNQISKELLETFQVKVREEKKNEWTISVPYLETSDKKLSDAELEKLFAADFTCTCKGCMTQQTGW